MVASTPSEETPTLAHIGIRRHAARSDAFVVMTWAHLRPGRFHALLAETSVTVWSAVVGDSDAYGRWVPAQDERRVDLVGDDPGPVPVDDLGEGQQLGPLEHPAERVVGVAEQHRAGTAGQGAVQRLEVEGRAPGHVGHRHVHLRAAGHLDDVEERHVDRGRDDHGVVLVAELLQRERHPAHDVGDEEDVVGVDGPAVPPGEVGHEDLGQPGPAGVERVAEGLGVDAPVQGLRDDRRRGVVHLGDPHREHVGGLAGPLEGPAGAQPVGGERLEVDRHALRPAPSSGASVWLNVRR